MCIPNDQGKELLRRFWVKQRPLAVAALPLKPPADRPAPRALLSEADMAAARTRSWPQGAFRLRPVLPMKCGQPHQCDTGIIGHCSESAFAQRSLAPQSPSVVVHGLVSTDCILRWPCANARPTAVASSTAAVHSAGTPIQMPARGSITIAILPHVAPDVRWLTGVVSAAFSPSAITTLSEYWQARTPPESSPQQRL